MFGVCTGGGAGFSGSSKLGMVGGFDPVRAVAAGTEQIAQPIVREVPEPTSNPAGRLNDSVHSLGGAIGGALGFQVGDYFLPPGIQGPSELGNFRDRARQERSQGSATSSRPRSGAAW